MLINQHFSFLFEPQTSHCSAYCYELFQTIWILAIKRCKINSNSNIKLLHKLVIGEWRFLKEVRLEKSRHHPIMTNKHSYFRPKVILSENSIRNTRPMSSNKTGLKSAKESYGGMF